MTTFDPFASSSGYSGISGQSKDTQRLEWVLANASDGYLILDLSGRLRFANSTACRLLGLPPATRIDGSQHWLALLGPEFQLLPEHAWVNWMQHLDCGPRYLLRAESSTAAAIWLQVEIHDNGGPAERRFLLQLRDISAAVGEQTARWTFHRLVRHKLRSPLFNLMSSLTLMRRMTQQDAPDEHRELLEMLNRAVARLNSEVQQILTYLESYQAPPQEAQHCEVGELLVLLDSIKNLFSLQIDSDCSSATRIGLSRRTMEIILWELLENSCKFHPQHTPHMQMTLHQASEGVQLRLSDNGVRLAPEQLEQIWTPYYQAERRFTGEIGGMGLGLSMVATLIWMSGGRCQAYNRADQPGLTIELLLPLA